jgi:hypothetical protein
MVVEKKQVIWEFWNCEILEFIAAFIDAVQECDAREAS